MMGIHTWHKVVCWRRVVGSSCRFWQGEGIPPESDWEPIFQYADTEGLTPPEGEGWYLVSAFGVGAVPGAGGSPARPAKKRSPKT